MRAKGKGRLNAGCANEGKRDVIRLHRWITASRTVKLGGTVATVGFQDIGLQGFAPKLAGI
jgi:hypothetical protein